MDGAEVRFHRVVSFLILLGEEPTGKIDIVSSAEKTDEI